MHNSSIGPIVRFRIATTSDIITAARMVFESYAPYIPILGKIPPTLFEDFGSHIDHGNLWLMEYGNVAVGMVVLTPQADHMLLQSMCVMPGYQGLGFGRKLLEFANSRSRSMGMRSIRLYTNSLMERNLRIYTAAGYAETSVTAYDWGFRVHMEKALVRRSASKKPRLKHMSNAFC